MTVPKSDYLVAFSVLAGIYSLFVLLLLLYLCCGAIWPNTIFVVKKQEKHGDGDIMQTKMKPMPVRSSSVKRTTKARVSPPSGATTKLYELESRRED